LPAPPLWQPEKGPVKQHCSYGATTALLPHCYGTTTVYLPCGPTPMGNTPWGCRRNAFRSPGLVCLTKVATPDRKALLERILGPTPGSNQTGGISSLMEDSDQVWLKDVRLVRFGP
jgi:hypothetical protein